MVKFYYTGNEVFNSTPLSFGVLRFLTNNGWEFSEVGYDKLIYINDGQFFRVNNKIELDGEVKDTIVLHTGTPIDGYLNINILTDYYNIPSILSSNGYIFANNDMPLPYFYKNNAHTKIRMNIQIGSDCVYSDRLICNHHSNTPISHFTLDEIVSYSTDETGLCGDDVGLWSDKDGNNLSNILKSLPKSNKYWLADLSPYTFLQYYNDILNCGLNLTVNVRMSTNTQDLDGKIFSKSDLDFNDLNNKVNLCRVNGIKMVCYMEFGFENQTNEEFVNSITSAKDTYDTTCIGECYDSNHKPACKLIHDNLDLIKSFDCILYYRLNHVYDKTEVTDIIRNDNNVYIWDVVYNYNF